MIRSKRAVRLASRHLATALAPHAPAATTAATTSSDDASGDDSESSAAAQG